MKPSAPGSMTGCAPQRGHRSPSTCDKNQPERADRAIEPKKPTANAGSKCGLTKKRLSRRIARNIRSQPFANQPPSKMAKTPANPAPNTPSTMPGRLCWNAGSVNKPHKIELVPPIITILHIVPDQMNDRSDLRSGASSTVASDKGQPNTYHLTPTPEPNNPPARRSTALGRRCRLRPSTPRLSSISRAGLRAASRS